MNNNDDLLKNYIESQKRQREILEETKKRRLKNENFVDPLEDNSKNLIEPIKKYLFLIMKIKIMQISQHLFLKR